MRSDRSSVRWSALGFPEAEVSTVVAGLGKVTVGTKLIQQAIEYRDSNGMDDTEFELLDASNMVNPGPAWQAIRAIPSRLAPDRVVEAGANVGPARTAAAKAPSGNKKVFIVHGHDDKAKEQVARFVEKLGLEAVILHEQPNRGQTLIEKLEAHSHTGFAVIILSPDDGLILNGFEVKRARQNVLFEFGLFVGKIGRDRVCPLLVGDVERPSDIDGVVYVPMDAGWQHKLATELKSAGMEFDPNKLVEA